MATTAGTTQETKVLCSRCFREVTKEQTTPVEASGKKALVCHLCTEALKHEREQESKQ
jgi:hypothetical protein